MVSVSGAEEASLSALPDMLRNTPANIRKLAVEIEQFEGRQKYLAQTKSPSDGGDVRWYFRKVPLANKELAASVPRMEIVGKSDFFRFGMRDSLAIEAAFLQREEELLSDWWKEYAECSEGPKRITSIKSKKKETSSETAPSAELFPTKEERVGVPVKGGLYEVDLVKRHCFPVYWDGENRRVLRGHWFARKGGLDWLPLREDVSEQLEFAYRSQVWHRRTFQPSGLFAARIDLQGSTPGLHALFTGEDDTWEAWLSVDASGFSGVIGMGSHGIKLRRGYAPPQSSKPTQDELRQRKEEEIDDYCSQVPVRHLVFVVHGIGQSLEKSNFVEDVGTFRHITESLAERHLTSYQRGSQRVLYIPCQWRRGLKLSSESAVEKITLDGVRGLRVMLSATVHDILYYMSPIYCQDIIDSVSNQLNKLYLKFLRRNPGYDGRVSIYGHSLGSVLSYDILCHQETLSAPFPMDWVYKAQSTDKVSHSNNNTTSDRNISNSGDVSLVDNEGKSFAAPVDEDKMSPAPCFPGLVEEHQEESFNRAGPPASSDSDESSSKYVSPNQSNDALSKDGNIGATKPTSIKGEPKDKEIDDETACNAEDTTIKSLREKINFLEAKIRDLELEASQKGNGGEIITARKQPNSESRPPGKSDSLKSYTPYIRYTKLEFKVDTFFAVGSPLGVFLVLRNVRIGIGEGKDYWAEENINEEMPACRQMFNIFHPFDPVAYRIEPLICKEYFESPLIIPYYKGGKRLHTGLKEFTEELASRSQALMDHISSVQVKVLTLFESRSTDHLDDASESAQEKEEIPYGSLMIERLTGSKNGRVDHVLQDKTFRHPYISAIGSHTNYWRDYDTALFILKHLYREIPDETHSPYEQVEGSSTDVSNSWGWFYEREGAEEELPLTFADSALVESFTSEAKNIIKH